MSRARRRRQVIAWARYFNRYSHDFGVRVGGDSAARHLMFGYYPETCWKYIRRQVKR